MPWRCSTNSANCVQWASIFLPAALDTARDNAHINNLSDRFAGLHSDWFSEVSGSFDLIISNPPYIPSLEIAGLQREVAAARPDRGPGWRAGWPHSLPNHCRRTPGSISGKVVRSHWKLVLDNAVISRRSFQRRNSLWMLSRKILVGAKGHFYSYQCKKIEKRLGIWLEHG